MKCRCENKPMMRNPVFLIIVKFLRLYMLVGFILRIVLMATAPTDASFSVLEMARCLGVGLFADFGMGLLLTLPLAILYPGLNELKYKKAVGWIVEFLFVAGLAYSFWHESIFHEYGGGAPKIAQYFFIWKTLSFSIRFFVPKVRIVWRSYSLYFAWALYVLLFLFVTIGEYFFWEEFGVRYNFIAVDYLVYTHEVIGNIMESYAITPLLILIVLLTIGIIWFQSRHRGFKLKYIFNFKYIGIHYLVYAAFLLLGWGALTFVNHLSPKNQYVAEVEKNGANSFVHAFLNNTLEYDKFYTMLPEQEVKAGYRGLAGLNAQGYKVLAQNSVPKKYNIVLVTVESLSADFLTRYGNKQHITPYLDALMQKSLVFDSLYANGNRTVRGLEALSLCVPPSAGESIIKQKENCLGNFSVGALLKSQGYKVQFLYGGDSYFDNMGDFFSKNGYEVIDRKDINQKQITFANIWGVCDGDMFKKSLEVFDADYKAGKPFFGQIMTTSNHRPYTYPAGVIQYDGDPHGREAAVKYTDAAIGKFLQEASKKPWFKNTVFIIIADHCASSAGKTSLPVDKYHIPAIVFCPSLFQPQYVGTLCSQIDVMPTIMAKLGLQVHPEFAGQNIFSSTYKPRAFMATYQDLGYFADGKLTVLSPIRKVQQYDVLFKKGEETQEVLRGQNVARLVKQAQVYYQYVNLYLQRK